MRMKRVLLASTALALLSGAQSAHAGDLYVSVFGGANWVQDSSASTSRTGGSSTTTFFHWSTDADTGFVLGGAIGTHLDKWAKGLRGEVEVSYRRNDLGGSWAATQFTDTQTDTTTGAIDGNLSTFALMVNLWYDFDINWKVKPYVGGGVGWGRAEAEGALLDDGGNFSRTSFQVDNDGFAWQLGLGFNYEAQPGVNLGLGYRYFSGPDFSSPIPVDPGGSFFNDASPFGRLENDNHSVMVNLSVDIY